MYLHSCMRRENCIHKILHERGIVVLIDPGIHATAITTVPFFAETPLEMTRPFDLNVEATEPEHVRDLVRWVVQHGGYIHPSLELTKSNDGAGVALRVRHDASPIPPDQRLMSCSNTLSLSFLNATNRDSFQSHSPAFPDSFLSKTPSHTVTVFFISQQYLLHDGSFWWPYLTTLPPPTDPGRLGTPLWFTDTEKMWLKGTNLLKGCEDRENDWKKQYTDAVSLLREEGWDVDRYTW